MTSQEIERGNRMTHGSLFSGIGGFDLAAEWMGWENVFHCEITPFCRKVLSYYWPKAISYNDIKETDFSIHRRGIDVLSGGFPCQPYSIAGKRKGKEDDRHLWPAMLSAIKVIQPRWVVGENVHGIINWSRGVVFNEVLADLEVAGYETFPYVLPACGCGAPHRRERTWFIAHCNDEQRKREIGRVQSFTENGTLTNSQSLGRGNGATANIRANTGEKHTFSYQNKIQPDSPDTQCKGLEGGERPQRSIRFDERIKESIIGFENFPTQPPFCNANDGIPRELDGITFPKWRIESIKSAGNAIVPQVAYQIFKTIEDFEASNFSNGTIVTK